MYSSILTRSRITVTASLVVNLNGNGVAHRCHPPVFQGPAQPHRILMQA
jgi:hypothetical protein